MLDATADLLTFGALQPCPKCGGQYIFNKSNYICSGNLTEWVKCEDINKEPPRVACRIPSALSTEHSFLSKSFKVKVRAVKYTPPTVSAFVKKKRTLSKKT